MLPIIDKETRRLLQDPVTDAGSVTVGVTPVKVLDYNLDRRLATITNDSASDIYIGFGSSVAVNTGIRLNALGGALELGLFTTYPWLGEVWAVSAGAGNNLSFLEV